MEAVRSVTVVTPTFAPEAVGTPHYVGDLVEGMVASGVDVQVVTQQPYYPRFERFDGYGRATRRDTACGASVFRVPTIVPKEGRALWRAASEVNLLLQVLLAVLSGRVARSTHVLAVSPGVPFAVLAGALVRRRGGRLVVVVHDVQFGLAAVAVRWAGSWVGRLARAVEVWALGRADHLTVLSDGMGAALVAAGVRAPVTVVPLWPTVPVDDAAPEAPGTVLYSGNLGAKQGVGLLLEVAERLAREAPSARLVIRGQGAERSSLERRAAELGNVELEDLVPAEELATALAAGAVHVVPQLDEGAAFAVPSKVFNILAVGRPVVVTASEGTTLAGFSASVSAVRRVPPGDAGAVASEVVALLRDDDLRHELGRQARDWMRRHATRDVAVATTMRLLEGPPDPRVTDQAGAGAGGGTGGAVGGAGG